MVYALAWLADVLRAGGCTVDEAGPLVGDWKNRGHGEFGPAKAVLLHHTAGPAEGNIPSLKTLIDGRPDLAGPLCNLGLARDGTFYCVAAGKAYHAGYGGWREVKIGYWGNSQMIGIECENSGEPDDHWPSVQMDALRIGVRALIARIGASPLMVAAHAEYALPPGRKVDPSFDVKMFRESL